MEHPVNCVSWDAADKYCASRRARLPTREEWLLAAQGARDPRLYPWGSEQPPDETRVNACDKSCDGQTQLSWNDPWPSTSPAGVPSAGRSPEGVSNLADNVAEWASNSRSHAFVCGGSWRSSSVAQIQLRATDAGSGLCERVPNKGLRDSEFGFRCAVTP